MFWKNIPEHSGRRGRKPHRETGASGTRTSAGEEKRGGTQEILSRENDLVLALDQMGNSTAEQSLRDSTSPAMAAKGTDGALHRVGSPKGGAGFRGRSCIPC